MYAWRFGEILPHAEIGVLRGMEGDRAKEDYARLADQFGIQWKGRKYDRSNPLEADLANQAINHASTAMNALALVAVAVTGCVAQLGFIHEDSGQSFSLDIADMFRATATLPIAFAAARKWEPERNLEQLVRQSASVTIHDQDVMSLMISRIKEMFDVDDSRRDAQCA
jgi:CRISPR-associated protein Cas1